MSSTLSKSVSNGITLVSSGTVVSGSGTYSSPLTITSTGSVMAPPGGGAIGVYGSAASGPTLINQGHIGGGGGAFGGAGGVGALRSERGRPLL